MSDSARLLAKRAKRQLRVPASCVVYTPRPLADAIVSALGDDRNASWLDPCAGSGVFLESLAHSGVAPRRIRSLDIDPHPQEADGKAQMLRGQEFLAWSLSTSERFSRVLANPPFLAINRLPSRIRKNAMKIPLPGGGRVSLGSNCWVAFLSASVRLLKKGGSLGFVLPASWDYSDYAMPVREGIPRVFEEVEIHRCTRPLFPSVQEGSVVLLAKGYIGSDRASTHRIQVRRAVHDQPTALTRAVAFSRTERSSNLYTTEDVPSSREANHSLTVGDVLQLRLGAVTGDARYFVLSEEQRKEHLIPAAACRRVISRAHHLTSPTIDSVRWRSLLDAGERVWLFSPSERQALDGPVRDYLDREWRHGGCNRLAFKVKSREPWYQTPMPATIDGFMSGMSSWGPWVVFSEMPNLGATNTLYVVKFLRGETADQKAAWAMWLLTSRADVALRSAARRYADGLVKFEPGDITRLPIQAPRRTEGAFQSYKEAVELLLNGNKMRSQQIADSWFDLAERGTPVHSPQDRLV